MLALMVLYTVGGLWLLSRADRDGGIAGAVVEAFVVLAVAGVFVAVWLRERRA